MKFDNLYGNVPEEMHDKLQATLMGLPAAEEKAKNTGISPKHFSLKRLAMIAVAAVMCMVLAVTAVANGSFIKSLFQREQELIDPHSVIINKQDENDGVTLTVEKIAEDENLIYVYYKLHSDKPFETGFLVYESIEFGIENDKDPTLIGPRACVEIGGTNINRAIVAGAYLTNIKEPTCDIDGVLEMRKIMTGRYIRTAGGREVIRTEDIELESGRYHFIVNGLTVGRYISDENNEIDEMNSKVEQFKYTDKLDVAFDFNINCLEKMPATVWYPDSEFTLEGCTFKIKEIKQTPINLWVTISSESDKVIEIEDQHFNPLAMFMYYNYSNEFNIYDPHTPEEIEEFRKIFERNKLWKTNYKFGVNMNGEPDEQWPDIGYGYSFEFREGGYDEDVIKLRFTFDRPIYTEDIAEIYVYNDFLWHSSEMRPEEGIELTIWENK